MAIALSDRAVNYHLEDPRRCYLRHSPVTERSDLVPA
jgi:hypothetical protein